MAKKFIPSVLTANHLLEGDAVWWTGETWSRDIARAEIVSTPEAADCAGTAGGQTRLSRRKSSAPIWLKSTSPRRTPIVRREAIRADRAPTFAYIVEAEHRQAA